MAVTTQDTLVNAIATSRCAPFYRASVASLLTGGLYSPWQNGGSVPRPGAAPTGRAAATCTDDMDGSCFKFTNTNNTYLSNMAIYGVTAGQIWTFDRLAHVGGVDSNATGDQVLNPVLSIPASRGVAVGDADLVWWVEIFAQIGTTARNMTVTYTDHTDTDRTVVISVGGTSPANQLGRCFIITPNAGQPIKTIKTANIVTGTGASGNLGFVCGRLLHIGEIYAGGARTYDFGQTALMRLYDDACLTQLILCSTTSTGIFAGSYTISQG